LREVLGLFHSDSPAAVRGVDRAVKTGDPEELRLAAHALKGVLAPVGSSAGNAAALALEHVARSGDLATAQELAAALRTTVVSLTHACASAGLVPTPRRTARSTARRPVSKKASKKVSNKASKQASKSRRVR
jgi:HPt (histidine-containing phosphotransfer) domain-containing protein